jgi:hypothetical protein
VTGAISGAENANSMVYSLLIGRMMGMVGRGKEASGLPM